MSPISLFAVLAALLAPVKTFAALASPSAASTKLLVVIAHPDDEYYFAGFTYWLAHEKNVSIDEIIVTSGESGWHYADLGESFYHKKLKAEDERSTLASIRETEAKASDEVLGFHHTDFLREKDYGFTTDLQDVLKHWDHEKIVGAILKQLQSVHYDGVLVLAPLAVTHGHHKAASFFALEAAQKIPEATRPFLLAASIDVQHRAFQDADHELEVKQGRSFTALKGAPLTQIASDVKPYRFDRNQSFGYQNKLNYQMPITWMISTHKTQGALQLLVNRDDAEMIRVFQSSGTPALERARQFFSRLNPSGT